MDLRFKPLAEHSADVIGAVDADLAIRYTSPATSVLLGCKPAELQGHTLAELLVPEERAAFIARHFTRTARRGNGPDLFRGLRRDGSTHWVEARVATLPPGNGLADYLVTQRDADQHRRAQETLGQVNAELSTLASTESLTGLPNRRRFDATLNKEWIRALLRALSGSTVRSNSNRLGSNSSAMEARPVIFPPAARCCPPARQGPARESVSHWQRPGCRAPTVCRGGRSRGCQHLQSDRSRLGGADRSADG